METPHRNREDREVEGIYLIMNSELEGEVGRQGGGGVDSGAGLPFESMKLTWGKVCEARRFEFIVAIYVGRGISARVGRSIV